MLLFVTPYRCQAFRERRGRRARTQSCSSLGERMGVCEAGKASSRFRPICYCGIYSSSFIYDLNLNSIPWKAGDFNSIPTTLPMTIIRDHAALTDAWVASHPTITTSSVDMTSPHEMIAHFGVTIDSPVNTYSAGKPLDSHARKFLGKRLDYIFYREPRRSPGPSHSVLSCSSTRVVFTDKVPGQDFSFSDHFGLEATLDIHVPESDNADSPNSQLQPSSYFTPTHITTTIQALTTCYRFSRERSRRELIVFGLCIILLIALIISSAWLPRSWINPVFLLFTVFIAWLATTMFYEGFLYGSWELNALMNVIEELEIHRKYIDRLHGRTQGQW